MDPKLNCYSALFRWYVLGLGIDLIGTHRNLFPSISLKLRLFIKELGTKM